MRASMVCGLVLMITFTLCGSLSSIGASVLENTLPNSDRLVLERRDEEPQYPDDVYDSDEQDRWPTPEELAMYKRQVSNKRGRIHRDGEKGHIIRRQSLENSLYDLLSSKPRPAPERRTMENLEDLYASDLLRRHRIPRSADYTSLKSEPNEEQQPMQDKSSD